MKTIFDLIKKMHKKIYYDELPLKPSQIADSQENQEKFVHILDQMDIDSP